MWSSKDVIEETVMSPSIQEWRQAIKMPTAYRVGNSTLRLQTHFVAAVVVVGIACLVLLYTLLPINSKSHSSLVSDLNIHDDQHNHLNPEKLIEPCPPNIMSKRPYNSTYPLTHPETNADGSIRYRIGVISDLDTNSKDKNKEFTWISYFRKGWLTINVATKSAKINWDQDQVTLKSNLASGDRGMELSELVVFDGRLLTVDDRTGTVYEISNDKVIPWVILSDGNGHNTKGFKGEWATVKDEHLYIGGLGKEWTSNKGEIINADPQWVKMMSNTGEVTHLNWRTNYLSLLKACTITFPGYMIHEAVVWSKTHQKWFFLPRRASNLKYNDKDDEKRGTNYLLRTDETFKDIQAMTVGPMLPTHGFSSFKFVPDTNDRVIVALKSEENNEKIATYLTVVTISGEVWLPEQEIDAIKYEGVEFI